MLVSGGALSLPSALPAPVPQLAGQTPGGGVAGNGTQAYESVLGSDEVTASSSLVIALTTAMSTLNEQAGRKNVDEEFEKEVYQAYQDLIDYSPTFHAIIATQVGARIVGFTASTIRNDLYIAKTFPRQATDENSIIVYATNPEFQVPENKTKLLYNALTHEVLHIYIGMGYGRKQGLKNGADEANGTYSLYMDGRFPIPKDYKGRESLMAYRKQFYDRPLIDHNAETQALIDKIVDEVIENKKKGKKVKK